MDINKITIDVYNTITNRVEKVTVSAEMAKTINRYARKEKYLMVDLKTEKAVRNKSGSVRYKPSREISLELLSNEKKKQFYSPEDIQDNVELKFYVKQALGHLSAKERQLIDLLYFHDLTQEEVAKLFNVSQQYISKQHQNILKKLKKFFNSGC